MLNSYISGQFYISGQSPQRQAKIVCLLSGSSLVRVWFIVRFVSGYVSAYIKPLYRN